MGHIRRLHFLSHCLVVLAVIRAGMLQAIKRVNVPADDLRHVLGLDVLRCVNVVKLTSVHRGRVLRCKVLEIWVITVHVLLVLEKSVFRVSLTLKKLKLLDDLQWVPTHQ